jgi:membrane protein
MAAHAEPAPQRGPPDDHGSGSAAGWAKPWLLLQRRWDALARSRWGWLTVGPQLLWRATMRWLAASGPQLGASIAFYTMFALAPLLVVTIAIAGLVFGPEAARGQIVGQIEGLVGEPAAQAIQAMIESAWRERQGPLAALLGLATLLIGATGVFAELRRAFNAIAEVKPPASMLSAFVRVRLVAFALLLGCGFLAIVSLVFSAGVAAVTAYLSAHLSGGESVVSLLGAAFDLVVSVAVLSLAFAALLRWLPDTPPRRRALWVGAVASALLFSLGKTLIGLYIGRTSVSSSFGAAGSLAVLMLWVYYSSQIVLFGAALGHAWETRGEPPGEPERPAAGRSVGHA